MVCSLAMDQQPQPTYRVTSMTTHCPALQALSRRLRKQAKAGAAEFERFLGSSEFQKRWSEVPIHRRRRAVVALAKAQSIIPDGLPQPVKAQRMGDRRVNWADLAQRAKLVKAYAVCGNDHDKAGRMLRVTADCARLAKKRYLDVATPIGTAA